MEQSTPTTTMVCEAGRGMMSLKDRQMHFLTCRHPQCVALLAKYDQIAKYVQENLDKKPK